MGKEIDLQGIMLHKNLCKNNVFDSLKAVGGSVALKFLKQTIESYLRKPQNWTYSNKLS